MAARREGWSGGVGQNQQYRPMRVLQTARSPPPAQLQRARGEARGWAGQPPPPCLQAAGTKQSVLFHACAWMAQQCQPHSASTDPPASVGYCASAAARSAASSSAQRSTLLRRSACTVNRGQRSGAEGWRVCNESCGTLLGSRVGPQRYQGMQAANSPALAPGAQCLPRAVPGTAHVATAGPPAPRCRAPRCAVHALWHAPPQAPAARADGRPA